MQANKKKSAVIKDVYYGLEDHGMLTFSISLDLKGGSSQSFGGISLPYPGMGEDFQDRICRIFGVKDLEQLIGKHCFALYSFGYHNDRVEGLETEDGKRFILTSFLQKYDSTVPNRLDKERAKHYEEIERSIQRIATEAQKLRDLDNQYTDWEPTN